MRIVTPIVLALALFVAGCTDETAPRDLVAPAAPRGVFSVTGDGTATLNWIANTESDLAGYRVYVSDCPNGPSCPYLHAGGTTSTWFQFNGLGNGVTQYFAVTAVDNAGNESALSKDIIQDTPRPAGRGLLLTEAGTAPATAGYDFSTFQVRPSDDLNTDMFYASSGGIALMVCPFADTDIQDAGFATTLDAVDYAPLAGWAASGTVELIPGHCYLVRVGSTTANYAKFQVTGLAGGQVVLDWAYQVDANNRELRARPATDRAPRVRRASLPPLAAAGKTAGGGS